MSKKLSKTEKMDKSKTVKLDKTKETEIKEKQYNTKQVETSIAILESPEDDIVLEALLFLLRYSNLNRPNNLNYLIRNGIVSKLIKTFNRNICILRIALRLFAELLIVNDCVLIEIDQEMYDETLLTVTKMYIEHNDNYVKQFAVEILGKVAGELCRINVLIFKLDLFNQIFHYMKNSKEFPMLYYSILLFNQLLNIPMAVSALAECKSYDPNLLMLHMNHTNSDVSNLIFDCLIKMTDYKLDFLQDGFKAIHLIEYVFTIVMMEADDGTEMTGKYAKSIRILHNCLQCNSTNSYFIESVEFLELCQWVKMCDERHLLSIIEVFYQLSKLPEIKQILFDLSVEESILFFFRSNDRRVLNRTCQTVSNMTAHKYCCQHMFTPIVVGKLVEIFDRKNALKEAAADPHNEIALQTIHYFIRRYTKALDIFIVDMRFDEILIEYFYDKFKEISNDSLLIILEIIYRCLVHPVYHNHMDNERLISFLWQIFIDLLGGAGDEQSAMSMPMTRPVFEILFEIFTYLIINSILFRKIFIRTGGIETILEQLRRQINVIDDDIDTLTRLIYFIFSGLVYENIAMTFLHYGLVELLKNLRDNRKLMTIPLIDRTLQMAYNHYLPIKFYETGRLEITDKLSNKFYLISDAVDREFPFLDKLIEQPMSSNYIVYLVNYAQKSIVEEKENFSSLFDLAFVSKVSLSDTSSSSNSSAAKRSSTSATTTSSSSHSSLNEIYYSFNVDRIHLPFDPFISEHILQLQELLICSSNDDDDDSNGEVKTSQLDDEDINQATNSANDNNNNNKAIINKTCRGRNGNVNIKRKISLLAKYIDSILIDPSTIDLLNHERILKYKFHLENVKKELGNNNNIIPIGYLKMGCHCERALFFKALADITGSISCSLVRGNAKIYWNEIALFEYGSNDDVNGNNGEIMDVRKVKFYVVDLINQIGNLMPVGSVEARKYCKLN